jgi:hypothetical protein
MVKLGIHYKAQNMQTGSKVCMGSTKMCLVSLDILDGQKGNH